jgi:hypothetical protein
VKEGRREEGRDQEEEEWRLGEGRWEGGGSRIGELRRDEGREEKVFQVGEIRREEGRGSRVGE